MNWFQSSTAIYFEVNCNKSTGAELFATTTNGRMNCFRSSTAIYLMLTAIQEHNCFLQQPAVEWIDFDFRLLFIRYWLQITHRSTTVRYNDQQYELISIYTGTNPQEHNRLLIQTAVEWIDFDFQLLFIRY